MTVMKIGWKSLVPSCIKQHENPKKNPKVVKVSVTKQISFHGIPVSDISSSTISSDLSISLAGSNIHSFTQQELRVITQNFSTSNFIGEGGFGPVHKGFIDDKLRPNAIKAQPVAVKNLDLDGSQGHREWLTEVIFLGQLRHPHLVKLIGYCCEEDNRLLVYEYMPRGSLENQLFRRYSVSLSWSTRMKIALGAAKGLAFLHEAKKSVIYRDFKASNILLDSDYTAKLSDFGLAKDGPEGDDTHVSTRVMGTHGYAAPEYIMTGHLTAASDVYSFGVVLLELLTGRRSVDKGRPHREQNLVDWARPQLKDPRKLRRIMDSRLEGMYSEEGVQKAALVAYQCLSQRPKARPDMSNVVKTLEPLKDFEDTSIVTFVYTAPTDQNKEVSEKDHHHQDQKKAKKESSASPHHHHHHQKQHHHHNKNHNRRSTPSSPTIHSETTIHKRLTPNSPLHNGFKRS